ncbi:reverse transcriptase [Phytophthora megakarya]|uniref:Reverse transcriptase n=1 Tax=Phytophthora megakarya TaxID=4795 RepID=A0A225VU42_9STRA|nr:reverse transcriptase [Phytophthora megakarya]
MLFKDLTLTDAAPATRITRIRRAIAQPQAERAASATQCRFRANHWHSTAASRALFRRVSVKLGDNIIPKVVSRQGVDRLGNDFYRDLGDDTGGILTGLFNIWYAAEVFSSSLLQTDIFCLKKAGDRTNPMNYRPLALLNSDYKIFSRILAIRTSGHLHRLIHTNQSGFVPGRLLHDTVDLYSAAKAMVISDPK